MKECAPKIFTYFLLASILLLAGCATVDTIRDAPEAKGDKWVYDETYAELVELVDALLPALGLKNVEKRSTDTKVTVFVATHGITIASWGEVVRVTVTEFDAARTSVTVYWRSKFRDGIITSAPNWKKEIFDAIAESLAQQ